MTAWRLGNDGSPISYWRKGSDEQVAACLVFLIKVEDGEVPRLDTNCPLSASDLTLIHHNPHELMRFPADSPQKIL